MNEILNKMDICKAKIEATDEAAVKRRVALGYWKESLLCLVNDFEKYDHDHETFKTKMDIMVENMIVQENSALAHEKKLEELKHELEELKRQMYHSPGGGYYKCLDTIDIIESIKKNGSIIGSLM